MEVTYTRKPTRVGQGLTIWIPKDIVKELGITKDTLLEVKIRKVELKRGEGNFKK